MRVDRFTEHLYRRFMIKVPLRYIEGARKLSVEDMINKRNTAP